MAVINKATLNAAAVGFKTLALETMSKTPVMYPEIASEFPSNNKTEKYPWLGQYPRLVPWKGERPKSVLVASEFSIDNVLYTTPAVGIPRIDFEHDNLGIYGPYIAGMAAAARKGFDRACIDLLINGFTGLGYDKVPFFSALHRDLLSQAAKNNKTNKQLSQDVLIDILAEMAGWKGIHDEPLEVEASVLLVGPKDKYKAKEIVADTTTSGGFNKTAGELKVVVSKRITDRKFFVLATEHEVKPLIVQICDALELQAQEDPSADSVFWLDEYHYAMRGYHGTGYGPWFYAYGSTGEIA